MAATITTDVLQQLHNNNTTLFPVSFQCPDKHIVPALPSLSPALGIHKPGTGHTQARHWAYTTTYLSTYIHIHYAPPSLEYINKALELHTYLSPALGIHKPGTGHTQARHWAYTSPALGIHNYIPIYIHTYTLRTTFTTYLPEPGTGHTQARHWAYTYTSPALGIHNYIPIYIHTYTLHTTFTGIYI